MKSFETMVPFQRPFPYGTISMSSGLITTSTLRPGGNPSSLHTLGFDAGNILFDARRNIEDLMHPGGEVIFTSGGTESDNMALVSTARKLRRRGNHRILI